MNLMGNAGPNECNSLYDIKRKEKMSKINGDYLKKTRLVGKGID